MLRKTTGKLALSLIGSVFAVDLLASILFLSLGNWMDHRAAKLAYTALSLLILFALLYSTAWREGFRDPNRVKYGHMPRFMAKGVIAGLLADIPFAVLTAAYLIMSAVHWHATLIRVIYMVCNIEFTFVINHFNMSVPLLLLLLLPLPAFSQAGYFMGYRQISVLSRLIYKKKPSAQVRK